jgi:hypothetical protein
VHIISCLRSFVKHRGSIFTPQTRRVCEIAVLETQIADEKLEVNDVRCVEKIILESNTTVFNAAFTIFP